MTKTTLIEPYGGTLVKIQADAQRTVMLKDLAFKMPDLILNERQLCDFEQIGRAHV